MADAIFTTAETASGKVQGIVNAGIRHFRNVPYGGATGGKFRFQPPRRPASWRGVRECFASGPASPQVPTLLSNAYGRLIQYDLSVALGGMGEDCLHLNVWTPGLRDGVKRPVLFSIHGGGFAISSGDAAMYDGAEMARNYGVVVVTVTHRLASFGFLNLVDVGASKSFGTSGCNGLLDLVAALEWVRDNIAEFGGDPDCVMIFGQSGGGWKTCGLLAMPQAKGLFHRAAMQSGSLLRFRTREESAAVSAALIAELGLSKRNVEKIRDLPWQTLLAAQTKIGALAFEPVLDGRHLVRHPFDPAAPDESASVPLIVSTTRDDASLFIIDFDLTEDGLRDALSQRFGERAGEMLALYRTHFREKSPYLILSQAVTDSGFRRFAHAQAERKAAQARAPVFMYEWTWATPAFAGLYGAAHATDVPASMCNLRDAIVGGGAQPGRRLSEALSAAWAAFAKTGHPDNPRLPHWPAFDAASRATMIFDDPIRVENDPDADIRAFWTTMPPPQSVFTG